MRKGTSGYDSKHVLPRLRYVIVSNFSQRVVTVTLQLQELVVFTFLFYFLIQSFHLWVLPYPLHPQTVLFLLWKI